jgi:nucleotidyltransferase/DNA polymerase involved in DNA repair
MASPVYSSSAARAILQIDIDCFYAQVEMLRGRVDPDRPFAVLRP